MSTKNPRSTSPISLFHLPTHTSIHSSRFSFSEHKFIESLLCATYQRIHKGYFCEPAELVPDLKSSV